MTLPSLPSLPSLPPSVYVAALVSFTVALLLVLTERWHARFSADGLRGVQKVHLSPTPRVGGIAVILAVAAAWAVAAPGRAHILGVLILAGLPAFAFGLAEDLTKKVSVRMRLMATMASGIVGWLLTGVSITGLDVPTINPLMGYTVVSVAFTAFAVGGLANAVNIVDGFNGLASGFVVIALMGLALVAASAGDMDLALACLAIEAAFFGFWLVNWPWGKLFLGDGGSYFGGFSLAWASVLLIERNPGVSAFTPLLICIHPVTEVLFSIYRRRMTRVSPSAPDRLHLHTLVMRRVVRPWLAGVYRDEPSFARLLRNPVTGMAIALMTTPAVAIALLLQGSPVLGAIACLLFMLGYVTLYARLVCFKWCSPITFLLFKSARAPRA
jgi:UDP-N-acetylmuramyl pentapeptide phosphotransferase/UDP-N-acetylglucosamine-1-phosphate transferase